MPSSNSETIISNQTHVGDSTVQTHTGEKFKGDGYYGRSDGLHTLQVDLNGFLGNIELQGTLAINPTADDYFPIALGSGQIIAGILCIIKSLIVPAPDLQRAISV